MNITVIKEELCNILNVQSNTLDSIIKRDRLNERLQQVGYKLIDTYKVGKYKAYDIEPIHINEWDRLQTKYNIMKRDEHTVYTEIRLNNMTSTRAKLLRDNEINISSTTAGRYDLILVEEKAMQEDKWVYYKTNQEGLWEEINEDYYKAFWTECREYKYIVSMYKHRLNKGEISESAYNLIVQNVYNTVERFKGYMVVTFKTYKEAENTKKILDMLNDRVIK